MSNILIVDDEQNLQTSLTLALEFKGHVIDTAGDGEEAIQRLLQKHYDLVLTDIFMPNMNGLELLKLIRKEHQFTMPIIVMTAYANKQNSVQILQAGANHLLIKPFDIHDLLQAVNFVLGSESEEGSAPVMDMSSLSILDEAGRSISEDPKADKIVSMAFQMLQKTFDADFTLLWVSSSAKPMLVMHATLGGEPAENYGDLEKAIVSHLPKAQRPLLIPNIKSGPLPIDVPQLQSGTLLAVPIQVQTQGMGGMLLYRRDPQRSFNVEAQRFLSILANLIAFTLEKTELNDELTNAQMDAIQSLFALLEAKHAPVCGHSARVACYALLLAKRLEVGELELRNLEYLALLHDLGKITLPDVLVNSEGPLSEEEDAKLREHAAAGEAIIHTLRFIPEGGKILRHHHEWFNGQGYPDGLQGEAIPLFSRIIAIANAFDIIVSSYPGHDKLGQKKALEALMQDQGRQFDPRLLKLFLNAYSKIVMINEVGKA